MSILFGSPGAQKGPAPETKLRIQSSIAGISRAVGWGQGRTAGNLIWYQDFQKHTQKQGGKGGALSGGKGGGTTTTYSASLEMGLCEGPISAVSGVWNNKTKQALGSLGFTLFNGSYSQNAWSYVSTKYPSEALNYRGLAYVAAENFALGQSAELPNLTFEIRFAINTAIPTLPDADPKDIFYDTATNANYGMGLSAGDFGDLSTASLYCRAAGLVFSPVQTSAQSASSFLGDILNAANCETFMSQGKIQMASYGDADLNANGYTYTAPSAPLYDLTEDDFCPLQENGSLPSGASVSVQGPVHHVRINPQSIKNVIPVGYLDRSQDYNPDSYSAIDLASVAVLGQQRASKLDWSFICDRTVATTVAHLQLGRQGVRNWYAFTIKRKFRLLDPMDVVTITVPNTTLYRQWVRIREISRNSDGTLSVIAEEYLRGTGHAPVYGSEAPAGPKPNYDVAPPDTTTPVVFQMPSALAQGLAIGVAAGGTAGWGGGNVWLSADNAEYILVGKFDQPCRQGVLTASLAAGSDPDTTNTLSVDLAITEGTLSTGTQADADNRRTLCLVDGEFISYETATLVSGNKYNLTYLRRGLYNTAKSSHAAGKPFVYLGPAGGDVASNIVVIPYSADQVGKTVYLKITGLNYWDGGEPSLASVAAYGFTIPSPTGPEILPITSVVTKQRANDDGSISSGVQVNIPVPSDPTVTAAEVQWRLTSDISKVESQVIANILSGTFDIFGLPGGSNLEVSYRYLGQYANSAWSPWEAFVSLEAAIADAAVTIAKFAQGITPAEIVEMLPTTGNFTGRLAFLENDGTGKLYQYKDGDWSKDVDGADLIEGSVVFGKVAAAAIGTDQLRANAVTASKMFIGDTSNMLLNTDFSDADYWSQDLAGVLSRDTTSAELATLKATAALRTAVGNGTLSQDGGSYFASVSIEPGGKSYRFHLDVWQSAGYTGVFDIGLYYYDQAGSLVGFDFISNGNDFRSTANAADLLTTIDAIRTVPATAVKITFRVFADWSTTLNNAGYALGANPRVNRAISGELVVDGSITAQHLNVATLSAISANIGLVTAGIIQSSDGKTVFDLTNSRITFDNGTYMRVQGVGFGSSNQFIDWFGPHLSSVNSCNESNAKYYLRTDGNAYFGGSLLAGTLTNGISVSDLSDNPTAETAVFGSNGGTIVVNAGFSRNYAYQSLSNTAGSNSSGSLTGASVILYRSINGGAYASVATANITGSYGLVVTDQGVGANPRYRYNYSSVAGASLTYTDPTNNTQSRQYKLVVSGGGVGHTYQWNLAPPTQLTQITSVSCVEQ